MQTIADQAEAVLLSVMLQDSQLRAAGLNADQRYEAMKPGVEGLLVQFQEELLETQREAAEALGKALSAAGF